jgi:CRISPR/Cas system endoribonuclease Cas6 (RAMP superfamily)
MFLSGCGVSCSKYMRKAVRDMLPSFPGLLGKCINYSVINYEQCKFYYSLLLFGQFFGVKESF